jgi:hypothetical protein
MSSSGSSVAVGTGVAVSVGISGLGVSSSTRGGSKVGVAGEIVDAEGGGVGVQEEMSKTKNVKRKRREESLDEDMGGV